ncbi:MAG: 4Fe-4S binding protein [Polyangiales bacterium]
MSFRIASNCSGCMACVATCPTGAIQARAGALQVIDASRCVECGACGAACPDGAVLDGSGEVFSTWEMPRGRRAFVDLARCTGCGWCAEACTVDAVAPLALRGLDGEPMRVARVDEGRCTGCGGCVMACGAGALRVAARDDPRLDGWRVANGAALRALGATVPASGDGGIPSGRP